MLVKMRRDAVPDEVRAVEEKLHGLGFKTGKLIGEVARVVGGKGGGKPTMAQAGGNDPGKLPEALETARRLVREKLGPVAAFKLAITVGRLPKTRSGKILRGTIKKIADGESWTMPATIEDPKVLDEIGEALKGRV